MANTCLTNYIVLDTETTGLSNADHIIELGAVKVKDNEIVETFSQLINPGVAISPFITSLTGITNDMVANAPTACELIPRFLDFCEGLPLVGHNVSFDIRMLCSECERYHLAFNLENGGDTLQMARECFPRWSHHSLSDLCCNLDIVTEGAHRALADVYATKTAYEILSRTSVSDESYWHIRREKRSTPRIDIQAVCYAAMQRRVDFTNQFFVVTGECAFLSRSNIEEIIKQLGGTVRDVVTKKTNYLICREDFSSNKFKTAQLLREAGCPIQFLTMDDFMELIGFNSDEDLCGGMWM